MACRSCFSRLPVSPSLGPALSHPPLPSCGPWGFQEKTVPRPEVIILPTTPATPQPHQGLVCGFLTALLKGFGISDTHVCCHPCSHRPQEVLPHGEWSLFPSVTGRFIPVFLRV